jgi:hypothetical protein
MPKEEKKSPVRIKISYNGVMKAKVTEVIRWGKNSIP